MNPPDELTPQGKQVWTETRDQLINAGHTPNTGTLLAYAQAVDMHREAAKQVNEAGIVIKEDGIAAYKNPAIAVVNRQGELINLYADQLGLNRFKLAPGSPVPKVDRGRWCIKHKRWECVGKTVRQTPCHAQSLYGLTHCVTHRGDHKTADLKHFVAVMQRDNPMAAEPLDMSPAEMMLHRAQKLGGEVEAVDVIVAGLEADELVYGQTEDTTEETPEGESRRIKRQAQLSMWMQLRMMLDKQLLAVNEAILRADVEGAQVKLNEMHAMLLQRALLMLLGERGIEADEPWLAEALPRIIGELAA